MHGCILWNSTKRGSGSYYIASKLITWRDQRCDHSFLAKLPKPRNSIQLSTGFGSPTLFWLKENAPEMLLNYDCAGTIMDYIVSSLCHLPSPKMSTQNAMSWGYYNFCDQKWNLKILQENDFPISFLPEIVEPGAKIGELACNWHGIPGGREVIVPLGDMQCSVLSCDPQLSVGVFNLSTSAQFSIVAPLKVGKEDYCQAAPQNAKITPRSVVCVPYFDNYCLYTAASLNGGAVFELFASSLLTWTKQFSPTVTLQDVYAKLCSSNDEEVDTEMVICPTVFGERHAPGVLASLSNIGPGDVDILLCAKQLANGIVKNVVDMFNCGMCHALMFNCCGFPAPLYLDWYSHGLIITAFCLRRYHLPHTSTILKSVGIPYLLPFFRKHFS